MTNSTLIGTALDAWERDPSGPAPFEAFRAAHPTEARYLEQLARGHAPPAEPDSAALCNLTEWRLIGGHGALTRLGQRLLATRTSPAIARAGARTSRRRATTKPQALKMYRGALESLHGAYVTLAREHEAGAIPKTEIDPLVREIDAAIVELAATLDLLGDGARGYRKSARQRVRKALGYTYP